EIATVLLVVYALSLVFSLHTHKNLFSGAAAEAAAIESKDEREPWSLRRSLIVLLLATALIAWISEFLVESVGAAARQMGMSKLFIGVIVVAIIGNAAEHSTAVVMALKNRMDLALSIANGSSLQIALFVAPVLLLASY